MVFFYLDSNSVVMTNILTKKAAELRKGFLFELQVQIINCHQRTPEESKKQELETTGQPTSTGKSMLPTSSELSLDFASLTWAWALN